MPLLHEYVGSHSAYLPCTQFLEGEGLHDLDLIRVVADEAGHRGLADLVQLQDLCHTYVHVPIHMGHKILFPYLIFLE